MNIYQKINAVRKEISYIQKDKDVSTGGGRSYKAVTHDQVTGMVRAALIEHGVVIVTSVVNAIFHPVETIISISDSGVEQHTTAKQRLYEATFQIDFVDADNPTDRVVTIQNAHALDNGDKAPGKAASYAVKVAILKMFNIETGESDESRYQEYDFADALTRAEASDSADLARSILNEAKERAVAMKDRSAIDAIKAVGQKLKAKFEQKDPA